MSTNIQVAALPFMEDTSTNNDNKFKICLITSRETGRWVIPKGWAKVGIENHDMAMREALEEAGLIGAISPDIIGTYSYTKKLHTFALVTCKVEVYPLAVSKQQQTWQEGAQRERLWYNPSEAAELVAEPELSDILKNFEQNWHATRNKSDSAS